MIHHFVIPSFSSTGTLPLKISKITGQYAMTADVAVSPLAASWASYTQYPASVPLATDTFVLLKAAGATLPPVVAYAWSGIWQKATTVDNQILLIPVRYDSETLAQTLSISDGVTDIDLSVTSRDVTQVAGTFAISHVYNNTLYSKGGQFVVLEGTGMNGVATVTDSESNALTIYNIDDSWLVIEMAAITAPGAITLTLKNSGGTTLGTNVVTVAGTNTLSGEAFYWFSGDYITAYLDDDDDAAVYAVDGGTTYKSYRGYDSLITSLNYRQNTFVRIMRDRNGAIIPYCNYTVMSISGTVLFTGRADEDGIISITLSTLPSQFVIRYDSFQTPIRQEFIVL